MRQNPHVRICGGPGSATTLVYPTSPSQTVRLPQARRPVSYSRQFRTRVAPQGSWTVV